MEGLQLYGRALMLWLGRERLCAARPLRGKGLQRVLCTEKMASAGSLTLGQASTTDSREWGCLQVSPPRALTSLFWRGAGVEGFPLMPPMGLRVGVLLRNDGL